MEEIMHKLNDNGCLNNLQNKNPDKIKFSHS